MHRPSLTYPRESSVNDRISEGAMVVLLQKKFAAPEFAFFPQIKNGTGMNQLTTADAVAMNLWPGRGLSFHGFEIKTHRNDVLREIKNPAKSEPVQKYMDFWWLVLSDSELIQKGELPETWGLMAKEGNALKVKVQAPKLPSIVPDRAFIASVMRCAQKYVLPKSAYGELHKEAFEEGKKEGTENKSWEMRRIQANYDELNEKVTTFEKESGVQIRSKWELGEIGKAVKALLYEDKSVGHIIEALKIKINRNKEDGANLKDQLAELEALQKRKAKEKPSEKHSQTARA